MVGIVTGQGLGLERSSASVLGSRGQLGWASMGRGGDNVLVNATTGNLVITRQDEFLLGLGPDVGINRTYNSQAAGSDGDNDDNWRMGVYRRIVGVAGGATVTRVDWDGSETVYVQSGGGYISRDGEGACDTLAWNGTQWLWTDGGSRTTETYDGTGKLLATRDTDGNSLTYTYSGSLITRIVDQDGEYTDLVYGGTGGNQLQRISTQAATGSIRVRYAYDGSNRLSTVTVDLSPADGSVADGNTYVTTYTYDGTSKRVASITQSDGSRLDIAYTQSGADYRVTKLTQTVSGGVTRVTGVYYAIASRETTITDALGGQTKMSYDAAGNLTQIAYPIPAPGAPASTTSFAYNANGDVVSVTEGGRTTAYDYDANGNMILSRDAAGGTVTRTYGSRNELLTSTQYLVADPDGAGPASAGTPVTSRYAYDAENHLRFTVSADGRVTEYRYNASGTLASTLRYAANLYNTAGLAATTSIAESTLAAWAAAVADKTTIQRTDVTYDFRGSISTVTTYSKTLSDGSGDTGATYSRVFYVYDQVGNLLSRQTAGLAGSETFVYDGLNRLVSSTDAAGALTTITFNDAATTTSVALAGGLSQVSVFNKAGERVSLTESGGNVATAVTTDAYDALGRLRMHTDPTGRSSFFVYDSLGRKVADVGADGALTEYGYDAGHRLVKTVAYMNKLTTSQIALLSGFSAGGAGGANAGGVGGPTGSNLVSNGGFEQSGNFTYLPTGRSNTDLPGWIKANPETFEQVSSHQMGVTASEGAFWLDLESIANTGVIAVGVNLLTNGSFEQSGSFTPLPTGRSNTDLPGWAKSNAETFEQVASHNMGVNASNGSYWLDLESIAQTGMMTVGSNLLVNGSFDQSGNFTWTNTGRSNTDLPGWIKANPETFEQVGTHQMGVTGTDGAYWLDMESVAGSGVPQPVGANLIVNGSFEQATSYTQTASGRTSTVIPGWNKTNPEPFDQVLAETTTINATDGIYWLDLDSVVASSGAGPNLLVNGSFEQSAATWAPTMNGRMNSASENIPGWVKANSQGFEQMNSGAFGVAATDGSFYLDMESVSGAGSRMDISQTVSGLAGSQQLNLKFDFANIAGTLPDGEGGYDNSGALEVYWNGFKIATVATYDTALTTKSFTVTTMAGNNTLRFREIGITDGRGVYLDNVRLYATAPAVNGGNMDINQTVSNLTAGQVMQLQFDHANRTTSASGSFEVWWNSTLVATVTDASAAMQTKSYFVTAVAGNNTLRFKGLGTVDALGTALDNVRLFATQTPPNGGNMDISQTVSGLAAGQALQLQFNHANRTTAASGSFEVWWNNALVATITDTGAAMQTKTYVLSAVAGNNTLRFKGLGTVDAAGASIDKVSLLAMVPVPSGGNMDISQTVGGLAAGQVMQLQFDHANRTTAASGSFEVWWNSTLVATISETGTTMQTKTYLVTAQAGNNTLRFKSLGTVDDAGASLDNVRLLATQPVPTGGNMDISQTIGGLAAGQIMQLQLDHANRTTAASGSFEIWWNNTLVATVDETGTEMRTKTYLVTAQAGNNTLRFKSLGTVDAAGASIDNIRLFAMQGGGPAAPAPVDPLAGLRPANHANDAWAWQIYDAADRVIETIDGAGRATLFSYDGASRLVSSTAYATSFDAGYIAWFKSSTPVMPYLPGSNSATDRATRSFYDSDGRLVGTLDGAGALNQIFYDAAGQVVHEIAYANPVAAGLRATGTFAQLLANVGISASDRRGDNVYDQRGLLRFTIDANGQPTERVYDSAGQLIRTIDYAGAIATSASYSLAYVQGQIAAAGLASNPATRVTRTVYDGAGRLAFAIDPEGGTAALAYDQAGNVIKETYYAAVFTTAGDQTLAAMQSWAASHAGDAGNRVSRQVYDAAGQLAYAVDAEGFVTEQRYDTAGRVTHSIRYPSAYSVSDGVTKASLAAQIGALPAAAVVIAYAYDSAGQLTDLTDGEGVVTHYAYDALGQVIDETIAHGTADAATLRRVYDAAGRVVSETRGHGTAEAVTTSYGYDALGNLLTLSDPRGFTTTRTYDALGRVLSMTAPIDASANATVSSIYNRFGDVVQVTDALGNSSFNYYDRLGRVVATRDAENYVTETAYNAFSEVTSVTRRYNRANNPASAAALPTYVSHAQDATTRFDYDRVGKVVKTTDAEGHYEQYTFDAFGQQISIRNKLGGVTTNAFDRRGLLVAQTLPLSSIRSDGSLQATTIINRFEYDSRGNRTRMIEAFGLGEQRTTTYFYDKADRLIETRADAVTILSQSDHYSQTTVTPTDRFVYDRRGNMIEAVNKLGARTLYYYDRLNRRVADLTAVGALTAYTHDANGNITNARIYVALVALPGSAGGSPPAAPGGEYRETSFIYDRLNRMVTSSMTGLRTGAWNGASYVSSVGSIATTYQYDAHGNVVAATDANGGITYSHYDKLGRAVTRVDAEGFLTSWTYDAEGNVLSERRAATQATGVGTASPTAASHVDDRITNFSYDRNGRRLTEQRLGVSAYTVSGTGALTYTPSASTIVYAYNGLGQVTRKTEATGEFIDYIYDISGRLVTENRASYADQGGNVVRPTVDYAYDGLNNLTRTRQGNEVAGAGDRITRNDYGPGGRLATVTDATGSVHVYAYDVAGNVVRESYSRQRADGSSVAEAILFTRDLLGRTVAQSLAAANGSGWVRGDVQTIAYNAFGEVSSRGLNGLWQERFDYDRAGRLWRTNSQDGVWRYFIQDGNGNQTLSIESEGTDLADKTIDQVLAIATGNGAHSVGGAYVDGINASINVYDKRNQAVATHLPKRQLSESGTIADLAVGRGYTAFGEIAWETDAAGGRTDFGYNTMGRTVSIRRPMVSVTLENGTVQNVNPTEYVIYDIAGRVIGTVDANGNGMNRTLLAGTGYGGGEAVTVSEFHADGGVIRSAFDVFGDLRRSTDEVGRVTEMSYDTRGRLTQVTRPSTLVENYAYDLLGQRIQHWNNFLQVPIYGPPEEIWIDESYWDPETGQWIETGHWETHTPIIGYAPDKELTDYDLQGRVTRHVAFGGDMTTMSYTWDSTLTTGGMGTFGGWVQTTTYANTRTMVEKSDIFGRDLYKKDLGDHVFEFSYDRAGRTAQRTGGKALTYSYLNSGLLGSLSTMTGSIGDAYEIERAVYGYDTNGNKISERFEKEGARWVFNWNGYSAPPDEGGSEKGESGGGLEKEESGGVSMMIPIDPPDPPDPELVPYFDIYQNATATYDALGRMRSWSEAGNATTPAASLQYDYDANGNVRRIQAQYSALNAHGNAVPGAVKDHWYRYDAMNRVVTSKGVLDNGQIRRGYEGVDILYDAAGQRASTKRTTWESAMVWNPNIVVWDEWGNPQYGGWEQTGYEGETREDYGYGAGGYLSTVRIAKSGYIDNGDGTVTATEPPAVGELKATHTHDLLGRLTRQLDWLGDGTNAAYDHTITYNEKGQIRTDSVISKQGFDTVHTITNNEFVARGADPVTSYALGAVVYVAANTIRYGSQPSNTWSETKNTYVWWDGALQDHVAYTPNLSTPGTVNHTYYSYDSTGQVTSAHISDGRPRTVTFLNNIGGQALRRDETNSSSGAPHEVWYRYDGRQLGFTGNNGTLETDYQTSIGTRTLTQGNGAFRFGQSSGSAYADFDQNYSAINSYAQGSAGGSYTVRTGDTLSSIAANLWGDGALWYKLAEANGMGADTGLVEGQQLTIPTGIIKNHHNSRTFKPYDPGDILGDLSPTTPRPPTVAKKGNKCGIFGQILLVIVAVVVTALTYGAASAALGPVLGGAVAGAAGSAASQAFGVVTGIQDKFDWKAVAMGALSGAVSGAVGKIPFLKAGGGKFADFAKDIARGALASAVTQGIGVATGLQGKFSWAGVAAAGIGAGVSGAVGRGLGAEPLEDNNLLANHLKHALATSAGAIASAATQSVIDGTDFGDNLLAALPDMIGGTLGNMIAYGVSLPQTPAPVAPPVGGMAGPRMGARNEEAQFVDASFQQDETDGKSSLIMCLKSNGTTCLEFEKFKDAPDGSFHKKKYHQAIADLKKTGVANPTEEQIVQELRQRAAENTRLLNLKEFLKGGGPFRNDYLLPILGDIFDNQSRFQKGIESLQDYMGEAMQLLEDRAPSIADFVHGFILGDGSPRESWAAEIGKIVSGLTPPGDLRDTLIAFAGAGKKPSPESISMVILSIAGWIPVGGDAAKIIGKRVLKWTLKHFPFARRFDDIVDRMIGRVHIRNLSMDDAVEGFKKVGPDRVAYARRIAELSTQTYRKAERVVLGGYPDYIKNAELHGGVILNTDGDAYKKIIAGMSKDEAADTFWMINEAFIDQNLAKGLPFEFVGDWQKHAKLNNRSGTARELDYLERTAPKYGYRWSGSSWIK